MIKPLVCNKVATLGPKGTYSELATLSYIKSCDNKCDIEYFSSIKNVLASLNNGCDVAVLPIENLSEGFISIVLDHIIDSDLNIIAEVILPIKFSFISNTNNIHRLYVQFVAKGQCSEHVESLGDIEIVYTESNIESLNLFLNDPGNSSAIVPFGVSNSNDYEVFIENVNDYENNQTRFLAFSKTPKIINFDSNWKTSLVIMDENDRPGLLADILTSFSSRNINLTSIISRPTRLEFGKYNFMIDFDGHSKDKPVSEAINEIKLIAKVKNMGSYPVAKNV